MQEFLTIEMIDEVVSEIQKRIDITPRIGLILGSGLGSLADRVKDPVKIHYSELPHWPVSTIEGHVGQLVIGKLEGKSVIFMQGRAHFYEGYPISYIGLPIRVMQKLGVETILLTNAAGAVNPDFIPGDLMLLTDHLNYVGMAGSNPLMGPNLKEFGPRFPDMSQVYDRTYMQLIREIAVEKEITLQEGVYVWLSGPSFETPADLRFLRAVGVDAVGMSTVPEAIVARHGGMRVIGISGISNKANLDGNTETTHEEVLEAGKMLVPKLITIVEEFLRRI